MNKKNNKLSKNLFKINLPKKTQPEFHKTKIKHTNLRLNLITHPVKFYISRRRVNQRLIMHKKI